MPGPKKMGLWHEFLNLRKLLSSKIEAFAEIQRTEYIALPQPIFEQLTSNLLHLKGMSYICVTVAQNWALSFILGLQFWSNLKIADFEIFRFSCGPALWAPELDSKKFWTRKLFCCTPFVPTRILIPLDPNFVPRFWRF